MSARGVIITGGSRGIGQAIVKRFAQGGDHVVFFHQREGSGAQTVEACAGLPGKVEPLQVDVSQFDNVSKAIEKSVEILGRLDVLVNNAGVTRDNLLMRMDEKSWDDVLDTNLKGAFAAIKSAVRPMMKAKGGAIVNVSSVVGLIGNPGQANYSSSKAGLLGLTKSVAREFASRQIRANAVCPGFIDTDMTSKLNDQQRADLTKGIPLERLGKPEDIAETIHFLCSPQAAYITGQVICVDGGMVM
ncbi:MAG: 3-oxoacyl-[acyl-carrier-protein] reductase [Planctomycetota bacterium]